MCETRGRRLLARGLLLNFIMNNGRDDRIRTCDPHTPSASDAAKAAVG
jgi:hypothetical protein